jgi:hypothetical protein
VLYRRLEKLDATEPTAPSDAAQGIGKVASARAQTLRARAARYRELTATLYNQSLIAEVEALVGELEAQASALDLRSFPFLARARR